MPISITCECGRQLLAKDEYAGRRTQCPDCGRELVIPNPAAPAPPDLGVGDPYDLAPGPAKPAAGPISFSPPPAGFAPGGPGGEGKTSGKAIASLVLGLLSFIFCCVTGVPGLIVGVLGLNEINASNGRIQGKGLAITGIIIGGLSLVLMLPAVLIALLLPAVQSAREAARRVQCMNNLKQVGLAMHNFESSYNAFPAQAITDANGTPLLSWRVAILPFIEQQALYQQFHLDEPWDSPHNMSLLSQMPMTYVCPSDVDPSAKSRGLTHYQVIAGPGTAFDPSVHTYTGPGVTRGLGVSTIADGTSNTVMVVEAASTVEWTRPDDLPYQPNGPLPPLGSSHPGGENVLMMDGSVRFLKSSISELVLRALFTRSGGEVVTADAY
ncbi:MAG: DUF1559 domain-containing protein [Isosphaeraceae bacterium]